MRRRWGWSSSVPTPSLSWENYCIIVIHNTQQAARLLDGAGFFWLGERAEFDLTEVVFTRPACKE